MIHLPDPLIATEKQLFALFATIIEQLGLEPYERLLGRSLIDFRDPTIRGMISTAQTNQGRMTAYVFGIRISVLRPAGGSEERTEYRYYAFYRDGIAEVLNSGSAHRAIESIHTWEDGMESLLFEVDRLIAGILKHSSRCKKRFDRFIRAPLLVTPQETSTKG